MCFLMFNARVHDLIYQKSNIQYRLHKITRKLMDLQQYSSLIANGEIRPETLSAIPGSMLGRTLNYLTTANNSATAYMHQTAPYVQQMWTQQNPQQQQMMSVFIMQQTKNG